MKTFFVLLFAFLVGTGTGVAIGYQWGQGGKQQAASPSVVFTVPPPPYIYSPEFPEFACPDSLFSEVAEGFGPV